MINDFKDLEKFLKILRKQGITKATMGDLTVELGELPQEHVSYQDSPESTDPYANFPQGDLTPSQLMFYSSGGAPEDDPELKEQ